LSKARDEEDVRGIALSITTEELKMKSDDDQHLVETAVNSATHTIVTDAIESLLRDKGHSKKTFLKHEEELSSSSLPGVVPISKQLFSTSYRDVLVKPATKNSLPEALHTVPMETQAPPRVVTAGSEDDDDSKLTAVADNGPSKNTSLASKRKHSANQGAHVTVSLGSGTNVLPVETSSEPLKQSSQLPNEAINGTPSTATVQ
jgi:hypothetical protein